MDLGSWVRMDFGWLDLLLMYTGSSFGFRHEKYVELARLNVTSRKDLRNQNNLNILVSLIGLVETILY